MLKPSPLPHFEQTELPDGQVAEVVSNTEHQMCFVPNQQINKEQLRLIPLRGADKIYLNECEFGHDPVSVMQEYMEQDQAPGRDFVIKTLAVRFLQAYKDNLEAIRFFN